LLTSTTAKGGTKSIHLISGNSRQKHFLLLPQRVIQKKNTLCLSAKGVPHHFRKNHKLARFLRPN